MKINPSIWLSLITKYKATVALVKSRDMHWGLMASRDHNDINLSSLRMLLVADGANPCKYIFCFLFQQVNTKINFSFCTEDYLVLGLLKFAFEKESHYQTKINQDTKFNLLFIENAFEF